MGFINRLLGHPVAEEEAPVATSSMMGVVASGPVDEPIRLPSPAFQAPAEMIGGTALGEPCRFTEPEVVPWPGVYTLAEDGVSPEYFLEFDALNGVYVYAELKNAR